MRSGKTREPPWSQPKYLAAVILAIVLVRCVFIYAYPFAFGHRDTNQYLGATVSLLDGKGYMPHFMRVSGTYALFTAGIIWGFHSSFVLIVIQHLLGVLGALLGGLITLEITRSRWLALLCVLLLGVLPKALFYEHFLLVESLYASTWLFFLWSSMRFFKGPTLARAAGLGALNCCLLLSRGQGALALILCIGLTGILLVSRRAPPKRLAFFILFMLAPSLAGSFLYRRQNIEQHHLPALSMAGNHNLFWNVGGNLIDYHSPRNTDFKELVRPCVLDANRKFVPWPNWGLGGETCAIYRRAVREHYRDNWGEIHEVIGAVAVEGILSHPVAFTYRSLWNLRDSLWERTSLCSLKDLSEHILDCGPEGYRIDYAKAWQNRSLNVLGRFDRTLSDLAYERSPHAERIIESFFWVLNVLAGQRFFTVCLGLLLLTALGFRDVFSFETGLLFFYFLGHWCLTIVPANGLWDRYYVPHEPIQIILLCVALAAFSRARREENIRATLLGLSLMASAAIGYLVGKYIPLLTLGFDAPILGIGDSSIWKIHRYVACFFSSSFFLALALIFFKAGKTWRAPWKNRPY